MRTHAEIDYLQANRGEEVSQSLRMIRPDRRKQSNFALQAIFGLCISLWLSVGFGQQLPSESLPAPASKTGESRQNSRAGERAETLILEAIARDLKSHRLIDAIVEPIKIAPSGPSNSIEKLEEFATNPIAFARLRFEPGLPADVVVSGPALATFTAGQTAEWRIGLEGKSSRLRVLLTGKPGAHWQFSTRVLLDSPDTGSGVTRSGSGVIGGLEIQPKSVIEVLKRLQSYDRWLLESSEEWKSLSAAQRGRDAIDSLSKSRLLGIRQRESERSLRRWLEIEALSKPLFERGYLDLVVHAEGPPKNDEAPATSETADKAEPVKDQR